jgi:hypothetical protein
MKTEQTGCSETSAYNIQTLGNYPEESIQNPERSESLKLRNVIKLQGADATVHGVMLRAVGLGANLKYFL